MVMTIGARNVLAVVVAAAAMLGSVAPVAAQALPIPAVAGIALMPAVAHNNSSV